jgi:hypothetical protein
MIKTIVLDSTPLGLLAYREGFPPADECHAWAVGHVTNGRRILVPAIINFEIRRELLRTQNARSIVRLDQFLHAVPDRYLLLTDMHLRKAAELWAQIRQKGRPTADRQALDIDVILAAQALSLNLPLSDFIIATSNTAHFSDLAPAALWQEI